MASKDFQRQLEGYGLTTAHILYRRARSSLAAADLCLAGLRSLFPKFPELKTLPRVLAGEARRPAAFGEVAHSRLIKPAELHAIDGEFRLH